MYTNKVFAAIGTFFLISSALFGAAPVTHLYFAEQYMQACKPHYTTKERATFMRGTLWPDIRYIAGVPRTNTHVKNVKLKDVNDAKDAFTAGKLFHSFVDEQREKITKQKKVYGLLTLVPQKEKATFLKGVEDEFYYKSIDVKEATEALKEYDKQERKAGVVMHDVRAWHKHLTQYLAQSPAELLHERVAKNRGILKYTAINVALASKLMDNLVQNEKMREYIAALTEGINKQYALSKKSAK